MIQVIDYQLDNIYGIIYDGYRGLDVKINDIEFKLGYQKEVTLTALPEKIFKKL